MQKLDDLIVQLKGLRGQTVLFIDDNELKSGRIVEIHIVISERPYVLCHVESEVIQYDKGITSNIYRLNVDNLFDNTESGKAEIIDVLDERITKIQNELAQLK